MVVFKNPKKIKQIIAEGGLTQKAFAEKVGVKLRTFCDHLRGGGMSERNYDRYVICFFTLKGYDLNDIFEYKTKTDTLGKVLGKGRWYIGEKSNPFQITYHWDRLEEEYLKKKFTKKPKVIFVNSMSDFFYGIWQSQTAWEFRLKILEIVARYKQHTFLFLTKRANVIGHFLYQAQLEGIKIPKNSWWGTSCENQEWYNQRAIFCCDGMLGRRLEQPDVNLFVSLEPLLGAINPTFINLPKGSPLFSSGFRTVFPLTGSACKVNGTHKDEFHKIKWVIAGAESGPFARPMKEDWIRTIRDACVNSGTPFFYKQRVELRGNKKVKVFMPEIDGKIWNQTPFYT